MSKRTVSAVRPTAAQVRAFASENPAKFAKVSEKAAHTLRPGARGRLHPEVIAAYNKGRKADRQYVLGRGKEVKAEAVAFRARAVALGAGARGPIRKDVLAQVKG